MHARDELRVSFEPVIKYGEVEFSYAAGDHQTMGTLNGLTKVEGIVDRITLGRSVRNSGPVINQGRLYTCGWGHQTGWSDSDLVIKSKLATQFPEPYVIDVGSGAGSECVATVIAVWLKAHHDKISGKTKDLVLQPYMKDAVKWLKDNTDLSEFAAF